MNSSTATYALSPGEIVARRFHVVRFLDSGRLGEVYEAKDQKRNRSVALRVFPADLLEDPAWRERLERDTRRAVRIIHPNVCRTFGLFRHRTACGETAPIVAVDLLDGESLAERIRREPKPDREEVLAWIRQIAEALEAGHRNRLIHRNLHSGNVILMQDRAVVADFGLTAAAATPWLDLAPDSSGSSSDLFSDRSGDRSHSGSGILGGIAAYMAPEQLEGGDITPGVDVYALGVLFYELITEELPFAGETPLASAYRRLRERPPSPRKRVPELDLYWERAVIGCLEPDPAVRWATPAQMIRVLDGEIVDGRRKPNFWRIGAVVVLFVLFFGGFFGRDLIRSFSADRELASAARRSAEALPAREDARRLYFFGLRARENFRLIDARDLLDRAARLEPESPLTHLALAETYNDLGEPRTAEEAADRALAAMSRAETDAPILEARAHAAARRWEEASKLFEEANRSAPAESDHGLRHVRVLLAEGSVEEASDLLQSLRLGFGDDERWQLLHAETFLRLDDPRRARDVAQRTARRAEAPAQRARARLLEARAQLRLERLDSALAAAVEARSLFENAHDSDGLAASLCAAAQIRVERGEFDRADRLLDDAFLSARLAGRRSREIEVLGTRAQLRLRQKRFEEAESMEQRALAVAREVGDLRDVVVRLARLADIAAQQGDLQTNQRLLQESLTVARILGDRRLIESRTADLQRLRTNRPSP